MATKSSESGTTIIINPVKTEGIRLALIGTSPIILNRMSEKSKGQLLMPKGRMNTAEKQTNLKHNPLEEYRASAYTLPTGDTLLAVMASCVKGAMMTAALDLPGTKKAQIGRLVYVIGDYIPVYGVPKLLMSVTRSADINHTPDIRTRAIVPTWAVLVTIQYVTPLLTATSIVNLLSAGGMTAGIGDWRPEKGKGNYGQFEVVNDDDPRFAEIKKNGGRDLQKAALDNPECYDKDSADLFHWYEEEIVKRGKNGK